MGKPSADEQKKMEVSKDTVIYYRCPDSLSCRRMQMFKKFQEAHPEMDFSNAKIGGMSGDTGFPGMPQ